MVFKVNSLDEIFKGMSVERERSPTTKPWAFQYPEAAERVAMSNEDQRRRDV